MKLVQRLLAGSVSKLTLAACFSALLGLALMSYSIIDPRAVPVITAMSVGHAFGISAFGCYLLAVVLDVRRSNAQLSVRDTPSLRHSVANSDSENRDSIPKPKHGPNPSKSSTE